MNRKFKLYVNAILSIIVIALTMSLHIHAEEANNKNKYFSFREYVSGESARLLMVNHYNPYYYNGELQTEDPHNMAEIYFDYKNDTLYLKNFKHGTLISGGYFGNRDNLKIVLEGDNVIYHARHLDYAVQLDGLNSRNGVEITTMPDKQGSLTIENINNYNYQSKSAFRIAEGHGVTGELLLTNNAVLNINMKNTSREEVPSVTGIYTGGPIRVLDKAKLNIDIEANTPSMHAILFTSNSTDRQLYLDTTNSVRVNLNAKRAGGILMSGLFDVRNTSSFVLETYGQVEPSILNVMYNPDTHYKAKVERHANSQEPNKLGIYSKAFYNDISSIKLNMDSVKTVAINETFKIDATILPTTAFDDHITYKSDDENIAVVDEFGNVTAKRAGTTHIVLNATNKKSVMALLTVIVTKDSHVITVDTDGNGLASANYNSAQEGTQITLQATANEGYVFDRWESDHVSVVNDKFTMINAPVYVKAIFKEIDAEPEYTYDIIKGKDLLWTIGNVGNLEIEVDADYNEFVGLLIDLQTVNPLNYNAKAGSTIITLLDAYLDTLDVGKHEVCLLFEEKVVCTSLTVNQEVDDNDEKEPIDPDDNEVIEKEDDTKPADPKDNEKDKVEEKAKTPPTGVNNEVLIYLNIILLSLGSIILFRKKRKIY